MELPSRREPASKEVGSLHTEHALGNPQALNAPKRERPHVVRFRSKDEVHLVERYEEDDNLKGNEEPGSKRIGTHIPLQGPQQSPLPDGSYSIMYRFAAALLLLVAIVPFLQSRWLLGHNPAIPIQGVSGGVIPEEAKSRIEIDLERRDDSPTNVCFRWAQQCSWQ